MNGAAPSTIQTRKIAKPGKKAVSSIQRETVMQSLEPRASATGNSMEVQSSNSEVSKPVASLARPFQKTAVSLPATTPTEPKTQAGNEAETANAFDDAARAMTEALNEFVDYTTNFFNLEETNFFKLEEARIKHHYYLNIALDAMIKPTPPPHSYVDDEFIHIDSNFLADDWEAKVWSRTYDHDLYEPGPNEVSGDLDVYTGEMEMEVSDLELWITHFDSELEGYEMFREHVMRHFGEELKWFMSGTQKEEIVTGDSDSEDDDCRRLL